jgi:hypothetical protein
MLNSKANWTCSYCSKILKDPILLPCEDNICRQHLKEKDSVKQNAIKCVKCKENFPIKGHEFKSIKTLKQLIEDKSYLSDEEINLKQNIEESIRKFFGFYDEFILNKSKVDTDEFNHFQELRFQIDEHRERLKAKIDDVALEMIEQTKKCEAEYLKSLKENLLSSFDESKSLDKELEEIEEELFRNPNLLIQAIKDLQQRQEESLKEIQSKLNKINQVKVDLKATNEFKPNLTLLNQESLSSLSSSFFGSMKLNNCSNTDLFKSQILTGNQPNELIKLCEFSPNDKWTLLYRGTRDGFGAQDFHSRCDNKSPTLSICKAHESSYIFGGFTAVNWESSNNLKYKSDRNAFIFTLTNKDNQPVKMKVDPNRHHRAIYCHSEYGPTFGGDIIIANNANTTMDSFSNLGNIYKHPQYAYGTNEAVSFLAGSFEFQLDEIEVYQKEE